MIFKYYYVVGGVCTLSCEEDQSSSGGGREGDKGDKMVREYRAGSQKMQLKDIWAWKVLLASLVQAFSFKDEETNVQGDLSGRLQPGMGRARMRPKSVFRWKSYLLMKTAPQVYNFKFSIYQCKCFSRPRIAKAIL